MNSFHFLIPYSKFLCSNSLNRRLLLAQAMKTSKPPDDLCGINANNFSIRETICDNVQCPLIMAAAINWNDN